MSNLEQQETVRIADRILDTLESNDPQNFTVLMNALSTVLVSLFLFQDFGNMPRERAMMQFLQTTFCRLKDAIDSGEHISNRMH